MALKETPTLRDPVHILKTIIVLNNFAIVLVKGNGQEEKDHGVSHMCLSELAGLSEMMNASLQHLLHKNPSLLGCSALVPLLPAPGLLFLRTFYGSLFHNMLSPGKNFRRTRIKLNSL